MYGPQKQDTPRLLIKAFWSGFQLSIAYSHHPFKIIQNTQNKTKETRLFSFTFGCEMTGCELRRGFRGPALVCGVLIRGET